MNSIQLTQQSDGTIPTYIAVLVVFRAEKTQTNEKKKKTNVVKNLNEFLY